MTVAALAPATGELRTPWKQPSILPGFPLAMGWTLTYLGLIVVLPLIALVVRPWELGLSGVWATLTEDRVLASLRLSFGAAFLAALTNVPLGLLVGWTLTRYEFPGRRIIDAFVDLPFALPTAVAGIALTAIYSPNGPLGSLFAQVGIKTAYSPIGIYIALLFIGLPFVVRTIQPVLQDLDREVEEAAQTLGATNLQRFLLVVLPAVAPSLISDFSGMLPAMKITLPYSPTARAKARLKPEISAGSTAGSTTNQKRWRLVAPKVCAASSTSLSRSCSTGWIVRTTKGRPMNSRAM